MPCPEPHPRPHPTPALAPSSRASGSPLAPAPALAAATAALPSSATPHAASHDVSATANTAVEGPPGSADTACGGRVRGKQAGWVGGAAAPRKGHGNPHKSKHCWRSSCQENMVCCRDKRARSHRAQKYDQALMTGTLTGGTAASVAADGPWP